MKKIALNKGDNLRISKIFAVSVVTVRRALNFQTNTELAEKIRKYALDNGGRLLTCDTANPFVFSSEKEFCKILVKHQATVVVQNGFDEKMLPLFIIRKVIEYSTPTRNPHFYCLVLDNPIRDNFNALSSDRILAARIGNFINVKNIHNIELDYASLKEGVTMDYFRMKAINMIIDNGNETSN